MTDVSRRVALQILGAGAVSACGGDGASTDEVEGEGGASGASGQAGEGGGAGQGAGGKAGAPGQGGAGGVSGSSGQAGAAGEGGVAGEGGQAGEAGAAGQGGGAGAGGEGGAGGKAGGTSGPVTGDDMLDEIDTFVVLMMENRSFDHYFGALQRDKTYANKDKVEGTDGSEFNLDGDKKKVKIFKATTFTCSDPPHGFTAAHDAYAGGKNSAFVTEAEAAKDPHPNQVMCYYDRSQIPFFYWLADNFVIADHWFCSVLGPTSPNRLYITAGTSGGRKNNDPFDTSSGPVTLWDRLKDKKMPGKLYCPSSTTFYTRIFKYKVAHGGVNPQRKMSEFFDDAKSGKLPPVSYIEPDWDSNTDHPAQDIRKGQAFIATVYQALAKSPQWDRCLFIITYDENGGFYDHVPPPKADDADPDFRRFGFRVPAILIGPTVRHGQVVKTQYDHTSVLATLRRRFGLPSFGKRADAAHPVTDVLDPKLHQKPKAAPAIPADVKPTFTAELFEPPATIAHPDHHAAVLSGEIPEAYLDRRPLLERTLEWVEAGEALGAITVER